MYSLYLALFSINHVYRYEYTDIKTIELNIITDKSYWHSERQQGHYRPYIENDLDENTT